MTRERLTDGPDWDRLVRAVITPCCSHVGCGRTLLLCERCPTGRICPEHGKAGDHGCGQ